MRKTTKKQCCECKKTLSKDEIALTKKILAPDINEFYCIFCLAAYLECETEELKIKIQEFKEQGCTLFL